MCKKCSSTIASLVAFLLMVAVSVPVQAKPSFGGSCTVCHNNIAGGMTISSDPIDIIIGSNDVVTFDILALPSPGEENRIALEGLENPGLSASILSGGDNWTLTTGSSGTSYISDAITTTDPYTLDLGIGLSAVESLYDIVVYFVGKGGNGSDYSFSVNVLPEPSADFNEDGVVDGHDFLAWQRGLGITSGATKAQGDADNNKAVDSVDLGIWELQYGTTALIAEVAAIPEPATLVLAMLSMASACCWRRKREWR